MIVVAGSITVTKNSVLLLTRVEMSSKTLVKKGMAPAVVTLKREYFCLKDEILNDFRKRIDVIYRLLLTFM